MKIMDQIEINGKWYPHMRDETPEEEQARILEEQKHEPERILYEIDELKRNLSETDYVALKIAEGVASTEDYSDVLLNRKNWRNQINALQETYTEMMEERSETNG